MVEIARIGEDDVGRLASRFERDMLHVALAGIAQEILAHLGGAGEGDHVHVHVAAKGLSRRFAEAGKHIQDAVRHSGFGGQFGDAERGERRLLGGLQDDGIARGEGRAELPGGHHQGIVPRHHGGHHADGLAGDQGHRVRAIGRNFVILLVGCFAVPLDGLRGGRNVAARRGGDGLSHVEGFEQGQFVAVLEDEFGEARQHLLALLRMAGAPAALFEGRAGRRNGAVHVLRIAFRDLGQHTAIDRRDAVEGPARGRRHVPAVDEGLVAVDEAGDHGAIVGGAHGQLQR